MSQNDSLSKISIGIKESNLFFDYGIFLKKDLKKSTFQVNIAYTKDDFSPGKKITGKGGYSLGFEYDLKLRKKVNYPFLALGITYRHIDLDSILYEDEMLDYSYHLISNQIGILNGWGYSWNLSNFNICCLFGLQAIFSENQKSNIINIWHADFVPPEDTKNRIIYDFRIQPAIDISLGYKF